MNQIQPYNQSLPIAGSSVVNTSFDHEDKKIGRRYILIGYLVIIVFFGSVLAWSSYAPMSSAAIAPGVVGKDGYRKTVQHLEGGIIDKILVRDGDAVRANQELIILKNVQSRSNYDLLYKQKLIAEAKLASFIAEKDGLYGVPMSIPDEVELSNIQDSLSEAIQGHIDAFYFRRNLYDEQLKIIDQRIAQAQEKIRALEDEQRSLKEKGSIIAEEQQVYMEFAKKGLVTRAQAFALKRDQASNETTMSANQVDIETTRQEINNLNMEKSEFMADSRRRIFADLDDVRKELVELEEKIAKSEDTLERTIIRAPISGVVVDLKVNTVSGVIKPGEPLLDIVPEKGNLIIEAQINPRDRDIVKVGQDAEIRFTAFNQRITEPVSGKVTLISADSLNDTGADGKQMSFYKAKVELVENPATVLDGATLYPGMQADVMIITGQRTAMQYFLKPIIKSFNRAFRDD